jgi:hypothetical protein
MSSNDEKIPDPSTGIWSPYSGYLNWSCVVKEVSVLRQCWLSTLESELRSCVLAGQCVCAELVSETNAAHVNSGLELRANSGHSTVESYEKVTRVLDLQQQ